MSSRYELLPSYGRRRGRRLRANRSALMETLLPKLLIHLPSSSCGLPKAGAQDLIQPADPAHSLRSPQDDVRKIFPYPDRPLWFEVGFGGGEHLAEQARRNPQINFIGCEPYVNGLASLLASIDKAKLENVRLYEGDARLVLNRLPDASLERIFVLFPDPWPKNRHHKRRIISQAGLALFHVKLKVGGLLRIATDHMDYSVWMLEHMLAFGKFHWAAKCCHDWENPPADWVPTRYQAKAEAQGRGAVFLDFLK